MSILKRERDSAIERLTLNMPEKLNALSDDMLRELHEALLDLQTDTSVRAVILAGAGKAFCAGHDLREIAQKRQSSDEGQAALKDLFDRCSQVMLAIRALPQPVIAQVHGIATAAGCQLVATCDLAVAADTARFGVNGVNIGLFCSTPMVALSRNIPRKAAFEMLTTGAFISAERAAELGLINRVVSEDDLAEETHVLAELIASKLGSAVKIGKLAFYDQLEKPIAEAYDFTGDVMVENMRNRNTVEGVSAFLEKRAPQWDQH